MPRKRQAKSRAPPKLPDGDQGRNLTEEERRRKLEIFIKDFENKVEERKQSMRQELERTLKYIECIGRIQLAQLPPDIRKMTLKEFMAAGGTIESVTNRNKGCQPPSELENKLALTVKKRNYQPIPEERVEPPINEKLSLKREKLPRSAFISENLPVQSSAAADSRFCTPADGSSFSVWSTPAVTPKFDPRLPAMPSDRAPKPGERLMSMAGSPVSSTKIWQKL